MQTREPLSQTSADLETVKLSQVIRPLVLEVTLEAGPRQVEFVKGIKTEMLAYNGTVPGQMIEVIEGDKFKVTFRNKIADQDSIQSWRIGADTITRNDLTARSAKWFRFCCIIPMAYPARQRVQRPKTLVSGDPAFGGGARGRKLWSQVIQRLGASIEEKTPLKTGT
jgi:hypothetical protein